MVVGGALSAMFLFILLSYINSKHNWSNDPVTVPLKYGIPKNFFQMGRDLHVVAEDISMSFEGTLFFNNLYILSHTYTYKESDNLPCKTVFVGEMCRQKSGDSVRKTET